MRRRDALSGAFWLLVGAGVTAAGWDLELGSVSDPGSGFMMFWIGLIMMALSLVVVVSAVRPGAAPEPPVWVGVRWSRVAGVLVALALYGWALPRLGFIVTTTLVMGFLFKAVEPQRWSVALGGAVVSALVAYVVFKVWLGAQLPAGVFEIG